jgi:hypothetical protein
MEIAGEWRKLHKEYLREIKAKRMTHEEDAPTDFCPKT